VSRKKYDFECIKFGFTYTGVRFEVPTVVVMKSFVFWDIMLCSLVNVNQLSAFLLGLLFNPEVGNMSLRNVS
jgi:hypothetical protein